MYCCVAVPVCIIFQAVGAAGCVCSSLYGVDLGVSSATSMSSSLFELEPPMTLGFVSQACSAVGLLLSAVYGPVVDLHCGVVGGDFGRLGVVVCGEVGSLIS